MEQQGALRTLDTQAASPAVATEELACTARGGDRHAFEALVRRYQRRVFGLAYQHLRDPDEAQDLAQEVFVRLYRNLGQYDPARPFEPWFWRLAGNVAANYCRRRRTPSLELREGAGAWEASSDQVPLELAVASLDEGLRLPLLLHYHADLPLDEVAASLGLSVSAVKSRLHRARAILRRLLAEEGSCL
jgi:RNA polymerase sigma-70 factor (ECF subfamily)